MVTPLQIDTFLRDLWGSFDPIAVAQLMPLAVSGCYKPKIYVGLDSPVQRIAANGYASAGIAITPGSLIYGWYMGLPISPSPWAFQMTDLTTGKKFFTSPVSQNFLSSNLGGAGQELNYPCLLTAPYPVIGKGIFDVEVWNQLSEVQTIVPLIGVLELVEFVEGSDSPTAIAPVVMAANAAPIPVAAPAPEGMQAVAMRAPTWGNLCWALRNGAVDASQFDKGQLQKLQFACNQLGYAGACVPPPDVQAWLNYHRANNSLPKIEVTDAEIQALTQAPDLTGVNCPTSWKMAGLTGYVRRR